MADYSMLTPYLVPQIMRSWKAVNIGDGFIAESIKSLLAPHVCRFTFSSREVLSDEAIQQINSTRLLVLAGANQLTDNFTVAPGIDAESLKRIQVPVVPMGIGIHGIADFNRQMSAETRNVLRALHERVPYSSWRCPRTIDYLRRQCPEVLNKSLMTCCPVTYREPLLAGTPFSDRVSRVVVTITERGDFWDREKQTIDFVARHFPSADKVLSLHQVFPALAAPSKAAPVKKKPHWSSAFRRWWRTPARSPVTGSPTANSPTDRSPQALHKYAERQGFAVYRPDDVAGCWKFYESCDLHVGSRLHAHLYFLSKARRSYLSYVDDRCLGISEALQFPLCEPTAWHRWLDYDFERCRAAAHSCQKTMNRFVASVQELLA